MVCPNIHAVRPHTDLSSSVTVWQTCQNTWLMSREQRLIYVCFMCVCVHMNGSSVFETVLCICSSEGWIVKTTKATTSEFVISVQTYFLTVWVIQCIKNYFLLINRCLLRKQSTSSVCSLAYVSVLLLDTVHILVNFYLCYSVFLPTKSSKIMFFLLTLYGINWRVLQLCFSLFMPLSLYLIFLYFSLYILVNIYNLVF